jgi:hypothetical protein
MKAIRWILGFLGVFIFVFVVDLVFYNYVFNSILMAQGDLVRSSEELRKFLPLMFLGQFIFSLVFTYYFFKIYKNAKFIVLRGLFFGFWIGLFLFGVRYIAEFYLLTLSKRLLTYIFILGWFECIFAGIGLGVVGWIIPKLFESMTKQAQAAPAAQPQQPSAPAPPPSAPAPPASPPQAVPPPDEPST